MEDKKESWFDRHFVSNWRSSWQLTSVQFAAFASATSGVIAASPDLLLSLVHFLPEGGWLRPAIIAMVVIVMFVVPWVLRVWKQEDKNDGNPPAAE